MQASPGEEPQSRPHNNVHIPPTQFPIQHIHNGQQDQNQDDDSGAIEIIRQMIFYLKQEQLCPQLLAFKDRPFYELKTLLKEQEEKLKLYKQPEDQKETSNAEKNFKTIIYCMEMEKVSFLLKHYLKVRLDKAQTIMSKSEFDYLGKYAALKYKYYDKNVMKHLSKNYRGIGGLELFYQKPEQIKLVQSNQSNCTVVQPDMGEYVFVKINRNPREYRYKIDMPINDIPQGQSQIASMNDIAFIPYGVAKRLMANVGEGEMILL